MKTIKNVLLTGLFMISMAAMANNEKVENVVLESKPQEGNVTITEENETVAVSVLNTNNASYQLFIYSNNGDLVFKGKLGDQASLGKAFDFKTAEYMASIVNKNFS